MIEKFSNKTLAYCFSVFNAVYQINIDYSVALISNNEHFAGFCFGFRILHKLNFNYTRTPYNIIREID